MQHSNFCHVLDEFLLMMAAIFWGIGAMMIMIVVLPMWFLLRPKTDTSNTRSTLQTPPPSPSPAPSPFTTRETVGTPIPENGDKARSKICDHCGKFYLGNFSKCPHCDTSLEKGKQ